MLLLLGLASIIPGRAADFQSDLFSGTVVDNSKWYPGPSYGNAVLTQNGGLFYHNNGSGTSEDETKLESIGVGSVDKDWSIQFDARVPDLSQISGNGQDVTLTLKVWNTANWSNRFDIETGVGTYPGYGKLRTVGADLTTNDWLTSVSNSVFLDLAAQPVISMAVSWQASTKTFSTFYAPHGNGANWILLRSWNLGTGSPTAWSLDPAQGFSLYIGGSSENVNIRASDNVSITDFQATNAIITGKIPPTITTGTHMPEGGFYPLPGAILNNAYSQTIQATNGQLPRTWSVIIGSLPAGLSLDADSGTISGTPTFAGISNFRVRVTGADGAYGEESYSIAATALNSPEISVEQPARSIMVDGKAKRSFGTVTVKSSISKTFTIRNTGTATLKNLAVTKDGANARNFSLKAPPKTSLAPGSSTTFKVIFKPSAKGTRKATIHIKSNDADENPFDIKLTGQGVK
jgi:hypothetical protein